MRSEDPFDKMKISKNAVSRYVAEVLHITQPALSCRLSLLEEEIGVRLFHRSFRKIALTDAGILLRRRAREILDLVDKTSPERIGQEELMAGVVRTGSGELGTMELPADLCGFFREKYSHARFDVYTASADVVREWKREPPFSNATEKFIAYAKCFLSMENTQKISI